MMSLRYESLFISDTHLGLRAAKAEYLLDFLKHCECDKLYLVGDIFDLWNMKTGWHWPAVNNEIVRLVLDKTKRGTRVTYVPRNHDELFRDYPNAHFSGIDVCREAVHETNDLKQRYPEAHFLGYRENGELDRLLVSADVMVFPSKTDTFGLVMLEAMACVVPVATYPAEGPLDVIKNSLNGWMDEDLQKAMEQALKVDRAQCRRFAEGYSWEACTKQFHSLIQPHPVNEASKAEPVKKTG